MAKTLTVNGETKTIAQWSKVLDGVSQSMIRSRLNRGWDDERAITEPKVSQSGGYTLNGSPISLRRLAVLSGLSVSGVNYRLSQGMSPETIVVTPPYNAVDIRCKCGKYSGCRCLGGSNGQAL